MSLFLENNLSDVIDLNGEWSFKLADQRRRMIEVPAAWEATQRDKVTEGPALYRRIFHLDEISGTWLLEADAISFSASVRVNDRPAGAHTGMWSRFQLDITPLIRAGENEIEVEVWKPGETRYKLRESLAGFLPDVCNTFGGIWQGIRLRRLHHPALAHLRIETDANGTLKVSGDVVSPRGEVEALFLNAHAQIVVQCDHEQWTTPIDAQGHFALNTNRTAYAIWSPAQPALHEVSVLLKDEAGNTLVQARRRIGFRNIAAKGNRTLLNDTPFHLRGVLDWGWDEKRLCPAPPSDQVIATFKQAAALGFNLFKLCLYAPDETLFNVADELGMLLWLELPMWLPKVTPALRELAAREYEAILQRVHHHPSIVIVSLGCEMDAEVDAALIADLGEISRRWLPNALRTDNSGSSEAYGGALTAGGDFYDYHFYTDPHFFQPLIDHFRRHYQHDKPWIFGEFCDADTQRDWTATRRRKPFWLNESITFKREELDDARNHESLLRKAGVNDGAKAISERGRRQADHIRKFILEQTRRNFAGGGYVVTGWKDTPIATSSMIDDAGDLKVDAALWPMFNADRVLLLDRERRRKWTHGEDRPVYRDPFTFFADEPIEMHVILTNGAAAIKDVQLEWQASAGGDVLAQDTMRVSVDAGAINELAVHTLTDLNDLSDLNPAPITIDARLVQSDVLLSRNAWALWRLPRVDVNTQHIASSLNMALLRRVIEGEHALVWLRDDASFTRRMPFWREAIHVFTPAFERLAGMTLPHADLRFFGVATDLAIDSPLLKEALAAWQPRVTPLWRRFDARRMVWHDYVVEARLGKGRLMISTLRFAGGLGHQPNTLDTNPMGAWLLHRLASSSTSSPAQRRLAA